MRFVIAFAVTLLIVAPGHAIDGNGSFTLFRMRSCGKWLESKKEDGLWRKTDGWWLAGYRISMNSLVLGKKNRLEGSDVAGAMLWIDKYYKKIMLSNSVGTMQKLLNELRILYVF